MSDMPILNAGELPLADTHLIEASAGTGKTYNIVRIYLRLLLEKELTVDQILVMTFTKAATAEIRNRLSAFLREALQIWETQNYRDDKERAFYETIRRRVDPEKARLQMRQALLQLDEAAIYTIHGFCKRALSQQAFFSGLSFHANMEADSQELMLQATQDWYRRIQQADWYADIDERWPTPEAFMAHWSRVIGSDIPLNAPTVENLDSLLAEHIDSWSDERETFLKLNKPRKAEVIALRDSLIEALDRAAEGQPLQALDPDVESKFFNTKAKQAGLSVCRRLVHLTLTNEKARKLNLALDGVRFIREQLNASKARQDQLDFNDLIIQLRRALDGPHAVELQKALLDQFPAALVDEFQDTDPDQYQILNRIYHRQHGPHFLCMIGDPKQAIYAFRGGDVFAYLSAREQATQQWTMDTNYRSSPSVIDGYNRTFLQSDAPVNPEAFGFGIEYHRILAADDRKDPIFSDDRSGVQWVHLSPADESVNTVKKEFQQSIADWCVQEIAHLLNDVTKDERSITAGDIALLVRSYGEAQLLQDTLRRANLPSVYLSARQNVFQTSEARDLYQLLNGIWQADNDRLFLAALAGSWIGLNLIELDQLQHDERLWAQWQTRFVQWREDWTQRGLMSVLLEILQSHHRPQRDATERSLTNRLHLAERLQLESNQHRLPDALLHWFARALDEDTGEEDNQLRLESDDALIKIITMHGAKGLEYPIVFIPFASYYSASRQSPAFYHFHDRETFASQWVYLSNDEQKQLTQEEDEAERIRLLYVAMTRPIDRLYCCLAPFTGFAQSPLGLTLKQASFELSDISAKVCSGQAATLMSVNERDIQTVTMTTPESPDTSIAAEFHGHIERDWWLSSFSALTRHVGHSSHSTPDRDELDGLGSTETSTELRFRLAKGAEAGNLLHDTLEHCDFTNPDYPTLLEQARKRYSILAKSFTDDEFRQWIDELLHAPIDGFRLCDLPKQKTLREAEFYFPMEDTPIDKLSAIIAQRRGETFQLPDRHRLKGMMHGFIDLIFEWQGRYYVADYKSTHLGHQLTHYQPPSIRHSILSSHYDVQYAIYAVALHRYLAGRVPGYNPKQHFGGVYYFYLRGMHPDSTTGIYHDPIGIQDLQALDAVFRAEVPAHD
ncbi:exodeoxyribonuclease V subunit beta [Reinekea blandensis]|nr:exodeoxyribonuclease V subunit beta [Reinekea blandensis]